MTIFSEDVLSVVTIITIIGGTFCFFIPIIIAALTDEYEMPEFFIISGILFVIGMSTGGCLLTKWDKADKDHYYECVKDNYTVFLDGEKVTYPDKVDLDKYSITIDDDNKEIVLKEWVR